MLTRLYQVLDARLNLKPIISSLLDEKIPGGASWVYVFGSAAAFIFLNQIATGIFMVLYYAPTPDHAYASINYIDNHVALGAFIRGLHYWGASAMVIAVGLHMLQVYFYGAYKPPRDLMWMVGVFLLMITLAFAFTGYLLPWDQKAYWATRVGINMVGTVPVIGDALARILRGGPDQGALTLSRFFAIHVMILPWSIVALIALHLFVLRRVGPAGPFDEARARAYSEPFWPRQVYMDAVVALVIFGILAIFAVTVGFPLAPEADPSDTGFVPRPEWYFLFFYQLLKYMHGPILEPVTTVLLPLLFFGTLFALPYLGKSKERRPAHRPIALSVGGLFLLGVFYLMFLSIRSTRAVALTDPSAQSGKELYAQLGCSGCHRLRGEGGTVGPDLDRVGAERDAAWLMKHFKDPQSVSPGSIMPRFHLSEEDMKNLTAYMLTLK
jgi:ubiquinol-cytochrome c reductase cytochrome b subunit